jgi:LacI family repressor for deo operon, udp, cdd, tsx, nupC, and nupG
VDVDGRFGLLQATNHLLEQGHRRIAHISWPEGSQTGWHREEGYRAALAEAGIEVDPAWIQRAENSAQAGAGAMRRLLALPSDRRPTAVACVSDLMAIGAMNVAAGFGLKVGSEFGIVGFDDLPMAEYLQPSLTSLRQPIPEVGAAVVDLLVQQIKGETTTLKSRVLRPELAIRASSLRRPARALRPTPSPEIQAQERP